jgi:hypothetical protein
LLAYAAFVLLELIFSGKEKCGKKKLLIDNCRNSNNRHQDQSRMTLLYLYFL